MTEKCPKCGMTKDLCVCEEIAKEEEQITVTRQQRRFGKSVTVVKGFSNDIDAEDLASDLKSKLACGGTYKDGVIELQGDHTRRIKDVLTDMGFDADAIEVDR